MGKQATVLLVDDDVDQLYLLSQFLEKNGFLVQTAERAEAALRILDERTVDAVVTDHAMPDVNGIEFIQRIRANPQIRKLPIVLFAAAEPAQGVLAMEESGADVFFLKQDLKEKLIPVLRSLLAP